MQILNNTPITTNILTNNICNPEIRKFTPSFQGAAPNVSRINVIQQGYKSSDGVCTGEILFDKIRNFTISEYENLTKSERQWLNSLVDNYINTVNSCQSDRFVRILGYSDVVARCFKNKLDTMYGAGNYVFIPIGRSLSTIGKSLGYKIGEDNVKQLPMSDAKRFLNLKKCNEDFNALIQYLNLIGLSKEEVQKSGKHYIFADYCNTGDSLRGAKKLFTSSRVYGNLDNVHFVDMIKFLSNIFPTNPVCPYAMHFNFVSDLKYVLFWRQFNDYSLVDRCENLLDIGDKVKKTNEYSYEMKLFLFSLLDKEMKQRKGLSLVV